MSTTAKAPRCPNCNQPMNLARVTPRFGGLPELQTFECRPCRETMTEIIEDSSGRSLWTVTCANQNPMRRNAWRWWSQSTKGGMTSDPTTPP